MKRSMICFGKYQNQRYTIDDESAMASATSCTLQQSQLRPQRPSLRLTNSSFWCIYERDHLQACDARRMLQPDQNVGKSLQTAKQRGAIGY